MDRKLRIANVLISPDRGGLERAHVSYSALLTDAGYSVDSWVHPNSPYLEELNNLGTNTITLKSKGLFDPIAIAKATYLLSTTKPDLVITHNSRSTKILHHARKFRDSRLIGVSHSNKLRRMLVADYLIAVNPEMLKEMLHLGRSTKDCTWIPNFTPSFPSAPRTLWGREVNRIAFIGRADKEKGLDSLLRAFSNLLQLRPELELHVAGVGDQADDLGRTAANLGISRGLKLYPWVDDIQYWMEDKTLLVAPSLSETFGLVALEAAINGCPVLTSNVSGFRSQITPDYNGWMCAPGDVEELSDSINRILSLSPEDRAQVAKLNFEEARKFSPETAIKKINQIITKTASTNCK